MDTIGIDVHKRESQLCTRTADGENSDVLVSGSAAREGQRSTRIASSGSHRQMDADAALACSSHRCSSTPNTRSNRPFDRAPMNAAARMYDSHVSFALPATSTYFG